MEFWLLCKGTWTSFLSGSPFRRYTTKFSRLDSNRVDTMSGVKPHNDKQFNDVGISVNNPFDAWSHLLVTYTISACFPANVRSSDRKITKIYVNTFTAWKAIFSNFTARHIQNGLFGFEKCQDWKRLILMHVKWIMRVC